MPESLVSRRSRCMPSPPHPPHPPFSLLCGRYTFVQLVLFQGLLFPCPRSGIFQSPLIVSILGTVACLFGQLRSYQRACLIFSYLQVTPTTVAILNVCARPPSTRSIVHPTFCPFNSGAKKKGRSIGSKPPAVRSRVKSQLETRRL